MPQSYGSAGRLSDDSGSDMGDSCSSGRFGSDPGTMLPKISIMSLTGGDEAANIIMGAAGNDARTTGDSRSAAGSSSYKRGKATTISVTSSSQMSQGAVKGVPIDIVDDDMDVANDAQEEEQKRPAAY